MQPADLRVKGSSGNELHLLEWSREGVPMLLLHGFGNEAHIWDDFAPIVAPHYRTLALDHRGHGQSDWDREGRYDIDSLVDDVEAVFAELQSNGLAKGDPDYRIDKHGETVRSFGGLGVPPAHVMWDGKDENGMTLPDGIYNYRMTVVDDEGRVLRTEEKKVQITTSGPQGSVPVIVE